MAKDIIKVDVSDFDFSKEIRVSDDGIGYLSRRAIARLAGVDPKAVRYQLDLIEGGENNLSEPLQPYTGQSFEGGEISDDVAVALIEHFAYEAKQTSQIAKRHFRQLAGIKMREWCKQITGWQKTPSMLSLPGEPYWYKRVKLFLAQNKVPDGYFSIFQETIGLVADIETAGYILPDNAIPDISIGKCWANHLRSTGIKPESISVPYKHQYPGWAHPIDAKAYLEDYLPPFRRWFRSSYKTEKMPKYFKGKDQAALPAISKLLGLPAQIQI